MAAPDPVPDPRAGSTDGARQGSVGIVIATRNRAERLLATLERLERLPERPAIVVVDNASADRTLSAVRERFPGVRTLRLEGNRGAAARTAGVEALRTPYVAFNDDDSWWAPGALAQGVRLLQRHPRVAVIAARILVGPKQRLDPTCERMRVSPLRGSPDLPGPRVLGFVACGAIVRRTAFLGVGGFSSAIPFVGEEQLLALDLAAAGWELAYVDRLVCHHDPGQRSHSEIRLVLELRNEVLLAWLRRPLRSAIRSTLKLLARRQEPAARLAARAALRRLPATLARRRPIPDALESDLALLQAAADVRRRRWPPAPGEPASDGRPWPGSARQAAPARTRTPSRSTCAARPRRPWRRPKRH